MSPKSFSAPVVTIPRDIEAACHGMTVSATIRRVLEVAIKAEAVPLPGIPPEGRTTIRLPPGITTSIRWLSQHHDIPENQVYASLFDQGVILLRQTLAAATARLEDRENNSPARERHDRICADPFLAGRPLQRQFLQNGLRVLRDGMHGLLEGSTGLGKTLAGTILAHEAALMGMGPVYIATPTVVTMLNYATAARTDMTRLNIPEYARVTFGIMPGSGEFIDDEGLADLVDGMDEHHAAALAAEYGDQWPAMRDVLAEWVDQGGTAENPSPMNRAIRHMGVEPRWLRDDIAGILRARGLPAMDWEGMTLAGAPLDADKPEDRIGHPSAMATLWAVRQAAMACEVLAMTHAMLATAQRNSKWVPVGKEERKESWRLRKVIRKLEEEGTKVSAGELAGVIADIRQNKALLDALVPQDESEAGPERTWRWLPRPGAVVIDEVHVLENSFAVVHSTALPLVSLRWNLERIANIVHADQARAKAARKAVRILKGLETKLENLSLSNPEDADWAKRPFDGSLLLDKKWEIFDEVADDLAALGAILQANKEWAGFIPQLGGRMATALGMAKTMVDMANNRYEKQIRVRFSPRQRHASLECGPMSVGGMLMDIWSGAKASILMSATIYLPGKDGKPSASYVASTLSIFGNQDRRCRKVPAVTDPAIHQIPVLMTPTGFRSWPGEALQGNIRANVQGKGGRCQTLFPLRPPSYPKHDGVDPPTFRRLLEAYDADFRSWTRAQALVLADSVLPSALGGTLCLCTSYDQVGTNAPGQRGIYRHLLDLGVDPERIVAVGQRTTYADLERQFREKHAAGLRPVFLGVAAAWTGLDLRDPTAAAPADDTLLTDLCMMRLPINMVRSSVTETRMETMGTVWPMVYEALLLFKQGLGRLIRIPSPDLRQRRLWLMDGRIFDPGFSLVELTTRGAMREMLRVYPNRSTF